MVRSVRVQMSFKEIIHHYRQQPQARSEVFRSVTIVQARRRTQALTLTLTKN